MRKVIALLLVVAAAAGAVWYLRFRTPPEVPGEALFAAALPRWIVARARDSAELASATANLHRLAEPWPAVAGSLRAIEGAWPDSAQVREGVARLNDASRAARLPYWVDVQDVRGKPVLMSYRIEGRSRWRTEAAAVEVLRVSRLDNLNIEMGLNGHAGGDLPVVLAEHVQDGVMAELTESFDDEAPGNAVDRAVRGKWRARFEGLVGEGPLATAAAQLERREKMRQALSNRLNDGRLRLDPPEGFDWGAAFFERMRPYTDSSRPGGPLMLASDLAGLRRADEALRSGEGRRALDAVLEQELLRIEAHEARHALDKAPLPVPPRLLDVVGDDDMDFAHSAERELRAFFGELLDGPKPACVALGSIARQVGGKRARRTPHYFAAWALFEELASGGDEERDLKAVLDELCALPQAGLEERVLGAYELFYGSPFVRASREEVPLFPPPATAP